MAMAQAGEASLVREIERQYRSGDRAAALTRLELAVLATPSSSALRFQLGVLSSESGRSRQATDIFEALVQDHPELPEPYNNLAVLRAADGQLDQARALLEAALRADPAYATAHLNLGDVLVRLALRAYQSAARPLSQDAALNRRLQLAAELVALPR
ncbi:MAG: tetratricopeptide repeat protein [Aquabacterium sp.]